MEIIYLRRAIADERREAPFWEEQSPELRAEFLSEMKKAIATIKKGNKRGQTVLIDIGT